jgi:signal peptidase I
MEFDYNPFSLFRRFNRWLDRQHWSVEIIILLSIVYFVRSYIFGLYSVPTGSMETTMLVGETFFAEKFTFRFGRKIKRGDIVSFNDPTFKYSTSPIVKIFQKRIFGPDSWTKRVVGIPGDRIEGRIEDGKTCIYRNGEKLDEPFLNKYPLVKIEEDAWQLGMQIPFMLNKKSTHLRSFDPKYDFGDKNQPFYRISEKELAKYKDNLRIYEPMVSYFEHRDGDVFDITLGDDEYWMMGDNRQGSFDSRWWGSVKGEEIHGRVLFRIFSFDTPNSLLYEILFHPIALFTEKARWSRFLNIVR